MFHGAESDIEWLQKDLGLYVVGLFDTFLASKALGLPSHSLAYLLKQYAGFTADKKYQLADWRIRPLPLEMIQYARHDTHSLLYIFEEMRTSLVGKGLLDSVLQQSKKVALLTYSKERYEANSWEKTYFKYNKPLSSLSQAVFAALHAWRDTIAREEDESVRYVLPNHQLFVLAERIPLDQPTLLRCCAPTPPIVRLYAMDLVRLITDVKLKFEQKDEKPSVNEKLEQTVMPMNAATGLGSIELGQAKVASHQRKSSLLSALSATLSTSKPASVRYNSNCINRFYHDCYFVRLHSRLNSGMHFRDSL